MPKPVLHVEHLANQNHYTREDANIARSVIIVTQPLVYWAVKRCVWTDDGTKTGREHFHVVKRRFYEMRNWNATIDAGQQPQGKVQRQHGLQSGA